MFSTQFSGDSDLSSFVPQLSLVHVKTCIGKSHKREMAVDASDFQFSQKGECRFSDFFLIIPTCEALENITNNKVIRLLIINLSRGEKNRLDSERSDFTMRCVFMSGEHFFDVDTRYVPVTSCI